LFYDKKRELNSVQDPEKVTKPIFAWHGKSIASVEALLQENFKLLHVTPDQYQGRYTKGEYFSQIPTLLPKNSFPGQVNKVVLCQILLGKPQSVPSDIKKTPLKEGYNSIISEDKLECMIFNPTQVLPCYTVYFENITPQKPRKYFPVAYEPDQNQRRKMELKIGGRVLTTNYQILQQNAMNPESSQEDISTNTLDVTSNTSLSKEPTENQKSEHEPKTNEPKTNEPKTHEPKKHGSKRHGSKKHESKKRVPKNHESKITKEDKGKEKEQEPENSTKDSPII